MTELVLIFGTLVVSILVSLSIAGFTVLASRRAS